MSQQVIQGRADTPATFETAPAFDLVRAVDRAPLRSMPFDHIQMEDVFPAAFYREMLAKFPAAEKYHQLYHHDALRADGSSTRLRMYLYRENLWRLPLTQRPLWSKITAALSAPELETAFKRKFRTALEDRFQQEAEGIELYPVPILVRDLPGYRIGIHSDALSKAITVQFYLPRDTSQAHLGTVFHSSNRPENDQPVAMQFLPASGYAFAVRRKESWHSAPTMTEADGERMSIMLTYYVDGDLKAKRKRRLQRAGIFFGRYPKI